MDKISIIVPIYNVEKYIDKCVVSILNQTYKNFELILVDDGSPDNCPQICDRYKKSDSRIKVIHKENGGLSDARNAGMDVATGDYIIFIDSDDFIEPDMMEDMVTCMKENNVDIVVASHLETTIDKPLDFRGTEAIVGTNEEILIHLFTEYSWMATAKLFKTEIVASARFKKGILYEDFEFIPRVFLEAKRAAILPRVYYHYFVREDSIMGKTMKKTEYDFIDIVRFNINVINEKSVDPVTKEKLLGRLFIRFFHTLRRQNEEYLKEKNPFTTDSKKIIGSHMKYIFKNKYMSIAHKIALFCYVHSTGLFVKLFLKK